MHYPADTVYTCIPTDQGTVWLAATAQGLAGLWFDGQKHFPPALRGACRTWSVESENRPQRGQFLPDLQPHSQAMGQEDGKKWTAAADLQPTISKPGRLLDTTAWTPAPQHPTLLQAAVQLQQYLQGQRKVFDLPLDLSMGTAFQQAVWRALLALPFGHTTSYGALSQSIARPSAVRAVAAAVGRNPLSVVVPCHRVLGANGSLTGYAGGLPRKAALLGLEARLA
jgi:methylated-DNA-[protein]-cysteine S-methyltransferase